MRSSASSIDTYVETYRPVIEDRLAAYTEYGVGCPELLAEAIRHGLLGGGKRLRPLLVLLANQACGGELESAMPAACAVEMVHAYSMIHDDLPAMDDDDMRRGRPSCHKKFGEANAILAGDALLAQAFEVLAQDVRPQEVAAMCCAALARASGATALVGGQFDDLSSEQKSGSLDDLEAIHQRKTGALLRVSLEMGGRTANASQVECQALDEFGANLGLAFQITDDLLDLRGDEATIGKRTGKDAESGKLTYPSLLGVEQSVEKARALIDAAIESLTPFGAKADGLEAIARFVLDRNR